MGAPHQLTGWRYPLPTSQTKLVGPPDLRALPRTLPKPLMAFDVPGLLRISDDVPLGWEALWENPHMMVVEVEERMC